MPGESDVAEALHVLDGVERAQLFPVQPPHWLAETAAVLARRLPDEAEWLVQHLVNMNLQVVDTPSTYQRAVRLAVFSGAHLFDTLYHAVALETSGTLITADERYLHIVADVGRVTSLEDFRATSPQA